MPLMLQEIYLNSKLVLYTYIPESSEVHRLNNHRIFERTDDGDRDITDNSFAIKRLYNRKSGFKTEDIIFANIILDDFNMDTVNKARKLVEINNPSSEWKSMSNKEILTQRCFFKTDKATGQNGFDMAALLLFGKKEVICEELPWYKVDVLKRIKDLDRYDDRFVCEDNLIESYGLLLKYIENNIEKPFFLNDDGLTYNAIGTIVRELVSNLLIHREFMNKAPARILIYKDKILSENANTPRFCTKIDLENNEPFSKNTVIAKIFRMIGYADEVGSGFVKIKSVCKEYFDSKPLVEDKDIFKVNIDFLSNEKIDFETTDHKTKIIAYIRANGKINSEQCRELLMLEKSQVKNLLNVLIKENIVYRHGKGKATFYDFNNG